jgi:hypothetical protein
MVLIVCLAIPGCALPKKPMTMEEVKAERERQLSMISRVYPNKSPQEILVAAGQVFALADDDYTVTHSPAAVRASRPWLLYFVLAAAMGTDSWLISTEQLPEGTKVMAQHTVSMGSILPVPTTGGDMSATGVNSPGALPMSTNSGLYQLFYARLDYFLGLRPDWLTCDDAEKVFPNGHFDALCMVANDRTPDGRSAVERKAPEKNDENRFMKD